MRFLSPHEFRESCRLLGNYNFVTCVAESENVVRGALSMSYVLHITKHRPHSIQLSAEPSQGAGGATSPATFRSIDELLELLRSVNISETDIDGVKKELAAGGRSSLWTDLRHSDLRRLGIAIEG